MLISMVKQLHATSYKLLLCKNQWILSWLCFSLISILFLQSLHLVHWHVCHRKRSSQVKVSKIPLIIFLLTRFFENLCCELTCIFCGIWISYIQTLIVLSHMLQLFDASIFGFIDLCNVFFHKVIIKNMMCLAQDILATCCVNAAHYCIASYH
jgi:hypothetical protein